MLVLTGLLELRSRRAGAMMVSTLKRGADWGGGQLMQGRAADATAIVASGTCLALALPCDRFLGVLEPLLKRAERGAVAFLATSCSAFVGVPK